MKNMIQDMNWMELKIMLYNMGNLYRPPYYQYYSFQKTYGLSKLDSGN